MSATGGPDDRVVRATSFSRAAGLYERARPAYPLDAVRWLAGDAPCDVVDLGAGTGKLTALLASLGHRVVAVEPLAEMREELLRVVPGVPALAGSAESIPLADASADLVTVAQAFHWFDHGPALAEIARVLRPDGVLAIAWNVRDEREEWVARLSGVIGAEHMRPAQAMEALGTGGRFGPAEHALFAHATPLDREGLRDLVRSRSHYLVRGDDERRAIIARIDRLYDEVAGPDGVVLPYVVECYRARRA